MLLQQRNIFLTCLIFCIILHFFPSYFGMQPVENSNIRKLVLNHCQMKCQQKVSAALTSNPALPAQHPADTVGMLPPGAMGVQAAASLAFLLRHWEDCCSQGPECPTFSEEGKICHERLSVAVFPKGHECWECT